jgi:hypothetical protein
MLADRICFLVIVTNVFVDHGGFRVPSRTLVVLSVGLFCGPI